MRRRDDDSFVEFVAVSGRSLLRTAHLLCGSRDDAEDLLQTALEKAYRNWAMVSLERDPEPYVRRILVNAIINKNRRRHVLLEVHMAVPPEIPASSQMSGVELRETLIGELQRLAPRQRAVLVLRYWEDMSEADAAKILGCSVGTVKSQAARGLARLRKRLGAARATAAEG